MCKGVLLCFSLWWLIGGPAVITGQEFPRFCHQCMPHAEVYQDPLSKTKQQHSLRRTTQAWLRPTKCTCSTMQLLTTWSTHPFYSHTSATRKKPKTNDTTTGQDHTTHQYTAVREQTRGGSRFQSSKLRPTEAAAGWLELAQVSKRERVNGPRRWHPWRVRQSEKV